MYFRESSGVVYSIKGPETVCGIKGGMEVVLFNLGWGGVL